MSAGDQPVVLDASVVLPALIPGDLSGRGSRLLRDLVEAGTSGIAVPNLFYVECANALWKEVRFGNWDLERAQRALRRLRALPLGVVHDLSLLGPVLALARLDDDLRPAVVSANPLSRYAQTVSFRLVGFQVTLDKRDQRFILVRQTSSGRSPLHRLRSVFFLQLIPAGICHNLTLYPASTASSKCFQ